MKIKLLVVGKTDHRGLQSMIQEYQKRLGHYVRFEQETILPPKNVRNRSIPEQKQKEGEVILSGISESDTVLLLDENGKSYSSVEFSTELQKYMNAGTRQLVFVIGGPFGFSEQVYDRANGRISLSPMTFSHQMVRLIFLEQLYRAFTILRNESYHHQ
ncbi:23S rRNA (pseudouridine1915-N3)-methyltransferase [Muriicola jejuensis]|uniref:Ribosomal RNA large subunit methyltransferase H n=1 Tax=Muriicola jejuensis TaxID=504488 RepID=A0A6P0UCJ0_9FLAO|nr:23S rRNA (pseudouridine(1915)-N(3))-methyltransferase RlmH [Muriicola jejuensis]NER11001.1 23S rRNA (pseudouridine(1915)-N(3))-methyltransferase RlmH [Muriicola jejuensis]SMP14854.1 23S rRNA (pseudouridine1915-N3)-methyltransferase [Muriicola jejuensis]